MSATHLMLPVFVPTLSRPNTFSQSVGPQRENLLPQGVTPCYICYLNHYILLSSFRIFGSFPQTYITCLLLLDHVLDDYVCDDRKIIVV